MPQFVSRYIMEIAKNNWGGVLKTRGAPALPPSQGRLVGRAIVSAEGPQAKHTSKEVLVQRTIICTVDALAFYLQQQMHSLEMNRTTVHVHCLC